MKKILAIILGVVLFSAAGIALAKNEKEDKFSKPLKVSDLKINKKKVLFEGERALMEKLIKDKNNSKASKKKPAPEPIVSGPTGILGESLDGAAKHAIVIGLSNYQGTINDLCVNPTNNSTDALCADGDSLNMETTLKEVYGYDSVQVFRDSKAVLSEIFDAVQNLNAGPDDEIVFFFSGHSASAKFALNEKRARTHVGLALYGSTTDANEIIWDAQLKEWFSGFSSQRVVFVFDTCHAGAMESYLEAPGREVVMSSKANQYSYTFYLGGEDGKVGEGMFTHFFVVEGILNGEADGYFLGSDKTYPNISVEEAFEYSNDFVPLATFNRQIPVLDDQYKDDLVFGI